MVKGVSKRVVVVRFPETRVFEQAIFFVRDDITTRPGVTANQIVHEACNVAESYVRRGKRRRIRLSPLLCAVSGAAMTGLAWLLTVII